MSHDQIEAKFCERFEVTEAGCWEWTAGKSGSGYGYIWDGARNWRAHRWVVHHYVEAIPDGMYIDHPCKNHGCVNPDHLEVVTPRENALRGDGPSAANHRKANCMRGHPFEGENVAYNRDGSRRCRTCTNSNWRNHKEKRA